MDFAQRLREARRRKGLSQNELGERINVHFNSIGAWENGARTPDLPKLMALADALGASVAYLTGETESPEPEPDHSEDAVIAPGLAFWGNVVDAARRAASRRNPNEISEVRMMLQKALNSLRDGGKEDTQANDAP